jgi:acetyl esterase/lipase
MTTSPIDEEFRWIARLLPRNIASPRLLRLQRRLEAPLTRLRRDPLISQEHVGSTPIRVHHPPGDEIGRSAAVLWMHGGGFIGGSPGQDDALCRRMARELGAVVAAVDYRLAPEHPFPAPLKDCHDALVWLAAREDVDPARVAIAGASAGGGLAAQLALLARERGEVRPAMQALVYPMLDDRTVTRADVDERHFRLWNNHANRIGWTAYLGGEPGGPDVSAVAAPGRNDDLSGLPPAWIGVGSLDLFHDEDVAYAARLRAAGVPCELLVIQGVFHGFDAIRPSASASRRLHAAMIGALAAPLAAAGNDVGAPGDESRPHAP